MFPRQLAIYRAPFVSSSSQRTERTNGFFKEKLFNMNLFNFLSCFLTLLFDLQISFAQRFQFLLFDKGNLFVVADNQIQLVMNEINSTNNTKKFELENHLFLNSLPNFNNWILSPTQKQISLLVSDVISTDNRTKMPRWIGRFIHSDLFLLDLYLKNIELSWFLSQKQKILEQLKVCYIAIIC